MAFPDPITIDNPKITINAVDYLCVAGSAMLEPEDSTVSTQTYCDPQGERPGATKWTATVKISLNYDVLADTDVGTWNTLHALRKTKQTFVLAPTDAVASDDNPVATFEAYVPSIPFMMSEVDASEAQTFDLEVVSVGDPVFAVT